MAMNGLDKITDRILAAAKEEADGILAAAQTECNRISSGYATRAAQIKSELSDKAEREGTDIVARAKSAAANQKRNLLLETKSKLVDDAFDTTLESILAMNDEKYTALLVGLLSAAVLEQIEAEEISRELYGEEEAMEPACYEVLLNTRDRARCGEALIEQTKRKLGTKVAKEKLDRLNLSEKTVSIDGGMILRYGDIESNCTLSLLFAQLREELEVEVSRALFDAPKSAF